MADAPDRATDEQLREWLYDAEYDWATEDFEQPFPRGTFPKYYADDYNPTLAALFSELLELRAIARTVTPAAERVTDVRNRG